MTKAALKSGSLNLRAAAVQNGRRSPLSTDCLELPLWRSMKPSLSSRITKHKRGRSYLSHQFFLPEPEFETAADDDEEDEEDEEDEGECDAGEGEGEGVREATGRAPAVGSSGTSSSSCCTLSALLH